MAKDLLGFEASLRKAAAGLTGPPMKATMKLLGEGAKADMRQSLAAGSGGDRKLSHWRGKQPDAAWEPKGPAAINIYPKGQGAVRVMESGATGHTIRPRRRGGALSTPYGPRPLVRIPHTRGKQSWTKGRALVQKNTTARAQKAIGAQLKGSLGG
jgi:hypothetical protein